MAQDIINELPEELLREVFNFLPAKDQLEASRTCTTWDTILSDHRFTNQQKFRLTPYVEKGGNPDEVKHFRNIVVKTSEDPAAVQAISQFLCSEEVLNQVEELDFEGFDGPLTKLFRGSALHLPKLKKLCCNGNYRGIEKAVAPELKHVVLKNSRSPAPCKKQIPFIGQVIRLTLKPDGFSTHKVPFYKRMGESYENLRHLEVGGSLMWYDESYDRNEECLPKVFRQLTYLKIDQHGMLSSFLWECIFVAKNLQSLHVNHTPLPIQMLPNLQELTQLRELTFAFEKCYKASEANPVTLPNLVRLTTDQSGAHLLLVTPNLRVLSVIAEKERHCSIGFTLDKVYPRLTALRLHRLYLPNMCEMFNKVPQLKILELKKMRLSQELIDSMMSVLLNDQRRIQRVCWDDCTYYGNVRDPRGQYPDCVFVLKKWNQRKMKFEISFNGETIWI